MGLAMGEQLGDARIAATALRGLGIIASNESAFVDAERYLLSGIGRVPDVRRQERDRALPE